jgi:hypothetical protein
MPEPKKTVAQAMEIAARIAERWVCRNCGIWFHPNDGHDCAQPNWERQGRPDEIAAAIRAEASSHRR